MACPSGDRSGIPCGDDPDDRIRWGRRLMVNRSRGSSTALTSDSYLMGATTLGPAWLYR